MLLNPHQIIVGRQEIDWWRLKLHCIRHHVIVLMVPAWGDHIVCIHATLVRLPWHVRICLALAEGAPERHLVRRRTLILFVWLY